ncbi:MAG: SDR family oxidoreductase [Propionibacteriaceae bacterium]|jgi:NAD(P)-dependent dehydrogenase (short-subunit alcohol dehydrogenase family)|nr:SDR family oxidoreductase [Propionibacteriaceae bacterium]
MTTKTHTKPKTSEKTKEFKGKVAFITGAASGIGEETAIRLAADGAQVVLVDLNKKTAQALADRIIANGGEAAPFVADVADQVQVKAAVDFTVSTYGKLDLAFNNAGIGGPAGLLADIDIDSYRRTIDVNLNSVFYGMYYEIPEMLKAGGGAIVNTSSILGLVGTGTAVPYVAAKHALTGMTQAAAIGYAHQNIRINSIHPGYIDTPLLKNMDDNSRKALMDRHAQGRFGTDAEVAESVVFLLSDRSSFTSGTQFVVDGGYTAH